MRLIPAHCFVYNSCFVSWKLLIYVAFRFIYNSCFVSWKLLIYVVFISCITVDLFLENCLFMLLFVSFSFFFLFWRALKNENYWCIPWNKPGFLLVLNLLNLLFIYFWGINKFIIRDNRIGMAFSTEVLYINSITRKIKNTSTFSQLKCNTCNWKCKQNSVSVTPLF